MKYQTPLYFGDSNAKLRHLGIATFALPAGHSCPGAKLCMARRDKETGRLVDGPDADHRCYAASGEVAFSSVARSVLKNMDTLLKAKTTEKMAELIVDSLPPKHFHTIRVHSGGDFFNMSYFLAWMEAARRDPKRKFYAYTKSLPFWIKAMALVPSNFLLTASWGGKWDHLIEPNGLRNARVVFSPEEAKRLKLKIDHDDSLARNPRVKGFALMLHNQQPKGSKAAAAIKELKERGIQYSYPRTKKPSAAEPSKAH